MKNTAENRQNPIERFVDRKKQELGMYAISLIQMALRKRTKAVR